ncbi:MAG TPA: family 16 glycoside hydrolase, partial [Thermoanaerobaculia bacterium]|nr:family 16 glycoside hydrolase [Thermoanaerobaculia bacterium]
MTTSTSQTTDFTRDVLGRYICNGLDEAAKSADTGIRSDARPFDIVIVGGGSFGGTVAQHLLYNDKTHSHRILVLEAGPFLLPEHVQNLPMLGLGPPGPSVNDPGPQNEVWGLPWQTDVARGFPGLAYCIGGRSLFFGGWSPELLEAETTKWPAAVTTDLRKPNGYFRQASDQIGTSQTNDFIQGKLHEALRKMLFKGVNSGKIAEAVPLAELPLHLVNPPPIPEMDMYKLEAPLAVQAGEPRSGFFPFNKFSSVPIMAEASRAAQAESLGDDVKKRLMIVPTCHVKRLITSQEGDNWRVVSIDTNLGPVNVPAGGSVIVALGTIESARLAMISFPDLKNAALIGKNLMAHLRSNLTIRIPRASLPAGLPNELQASALFLKGRHKHADNSLGFHHIQITAAGLDRPTTDTEPELFKKVPSLDFFTPFLTANDEQVVITLRGIGEMESQNPASGITLTGGDEFGLPRAFVKIGPSAKDTALWDAMDKTADEAALVFANGQPYEVLVDGAYKAVAANQSPSSVASFAKRRDGLGTTHHECGTLAMGTDSNLAVTSPDARLHFSPNTYVVGPALFPTIGSPNPMLTGVALARRLGDTLVPPPTPFAPEAGFTSLFNGFDMSKWSMSKISNQAPDKSNPGRFLVVDGTLEYTTGNDLGLLWYTEPMPADYVLRLQWRCWTDNGNSGVFVRFPNPNSKGYDNTAYVGVHFGFEAQIDEFGTPDGAPEHTTGAIYGEPGQAFMRQSAKPAGQWNDFEIRVEGQTYKVFLNGLQT